MGTHHGALDDEIGSEAAEWLLDLQQENADQGAFLKWIRRSPTHVRIFFEIYEADRILHGGIRNSAFST
jgi:ferric-dicitrate binding protein FerR (iron transport regulator)